MPMVFPGMDPYLEDPTIWPDVHSRFIVYSAEHLQPQLRPRYVAALDERVYIESSERRVVPDVAIRRSMRPEDKDDVAVAVAVPETDDAVVVRVHHVEIREPYLQILDLHSGKNVITVIEVISPSNKAPGPGRDAYQAKQREVLGSTSHLVEIDLLRTGQHVLAVPEWLARRKRYYDYLVCVNRAQQIRDRYDLYFRGVRERLPRVRIPLAGDDRDVALDIQAVFARVYDTGDYGEQIDYRAPCRPPLRPADQEWADLLIGKAATGQGATEKPA
jgi:hypothetical protein